MKKKRASHFICGLGFVILQCAIAAFAQVQDAIDVPPEVKTQAVRLSFNAKGGRLDSEFTARIDITNTEDFAIQVSEFEINPSPELFRNAEKISVRVKNVQGKSEPLVDFKQTIDAGNTLVLEVRLPPDDLYGANSKTQMFQFLSGSYVIRLSFTAKSDQDAGEGIPSGAVYLEKESTVPASAPIIWVIAGAILTVVFIATLRFCWALLRVLNGVAVLTWKHILHGVVSVSIGSLVVTLLIILSRYSAVSSLGTLPVAVSVNDAIGGGILGIFYKKLSAWLQDTLKD